MICSALILFGLLFVIDSNEDACFKICRCTSLTTNTLKVDCSIRKLEIVPSFPEETEELYLQENNLTGIPSGTFDKLIYLKRLNLSSNRLHCDCNIWYLKIWLDDQKLDTDNKIKCLTPRPLHGIPVTQLTRVQIEYCKKSKQLCHDFLFNDTFLFVLFLGLFLIMIFCLKALKMMRFELKFHDDYNSNFELQETPKFHSLKRRSQRSYKNYC
ncbi:platelet glycoprotein IX-like [Bombina bombina]|uniref:platelet glycoprotein IX-like n=1 Tax=Bombina bombina TaxID=8345 RepID=UPI00235A967B|nr:platelet glycoprotein IX-like [Bombina bombina]XP_053577022.1 platelet glycoprotein IX-like [Bombina bombina]